MCDESIKAIFEKSPGYESARALIGLLENAGFEAYVVGGAVRDALMGRQINDFDMASNASPEEMKSVFQGFKTLEHGIAFGTLGVVVDGVSYEITTYRGESEYTNRRHPDKIEFIKSRDEDLKRRDFTINAMMFHPEKGLYDPFDGVEDIKRRTLQTVGDPVERFQEDALRILRMFRFSINLNFEISEDCFKASKLVMESLKNLSKERVFLELDKALSKKVHIKRIDCIQRVYFETDMKLVQLPSTFNNFEKAYVVFKFSGVVPIVSGYLFSKQLKKDFKLLEELNSYKMEDLKVMFVRKLERDYAKAPLLLYSIFFDCMNDEQKSLFKKGFNEHLLVENTFGSLNKEILKVKKIFFGADIGKALMKIKVDYLWS